ncbi:ribbon-helix-helix protein, CopG family [Cutibacterium acnes]|uniref:ribbon-helix-helix protein, CopG family n=1 Tax=Cutibacterium acnes TaxID=1747 RepID=UPI000255161A|nr:ribbon-helix-helix protein, CopG family [Cutibacterium acnes]EIA10675.1 hypothetical protein TICEST70_11647 [Cutibacterium acnes PRP-38]
MSTTPAGFDFDALAEWAESDEATHTPQTSPVFRGKDAARASRAFLGGADHATGEGRSPRRQVRLDARTNARLDAYAAATGTSASQIIRDALADYLPA